MSMWSKIMAFFKKVGSEEHFTSQGKKFVKVKSGGSSGNAILDLIGEAESRGNYNAFFGNAENKSVDFTKMTIREVRAWQDKYVRSGSKSSAVGKYQIIRGTMDSLIEGLGLTGDELFDERMQDRLGLALLNRRGYSKWTSGQITKQQFANNLAREWASLPVIGGNKHGRSYYAGDGLNKALISPDKYLSALDKG